MNEHWGHNAKQNKPDKERHIPHDSNYIRYMK